MNKQVFKKEFIDIDKLLLFINAFKKRLNLKWWWIEEKKDKYILCGI